MPGLVGLSFVTPWLLAALIALPGIYFLLRVTPPAPKRVLFPPLRLLLNLHNTEETPARTPWWLLLLRLAAAALIIVALAEPIFDAAPATRASGPLVLFVDNGWPAASDWRARRNAMNRVISAAGRQSQSVVLVPTADVDAEPPALLSAAQAAKFADEMPVRPWLPDRAGALAALKKLDFRAAPQILWLSDGVDHGSARTVADGLAALGNLTMFADGPDNTPLALKPPEDTNDGFNLTLLRMHDPTPREGRVAAMDAHGAVLGESTFRFDKNEDAATAAITLPLELRNEVARIAVIGTDSAGTVQLLGTGDKRQAVGLVSGSSGDIEQPLLSDVYYVERALAPYAELREGTIEQMLASGVSVLVLTDIGQLTRTQHDAIAHFVENGGVLLRFAGPRLAAHASEAATDDLVPVKLRGGERLMGSALAWPEPQHLAPFSDDSPFRGLTVPPEVTVSRQVLADPSVELASHAWARLADGTPLVTGTARGKGWIVLFHVAASPGWSSLPLSGLYVNMLRRVTMLVDTPHGASSATTNNLPPLQVLDGFGRLQRPSGDAQPINANELSTIMPNRVHPPGYYGQEGNTVAFNTTNAQTDLKPITDTGRNLSPYAATSTIELKWSMLLSALLLLGLDALLSLWLRGHIAFGREPATAARAAAALLALLLLLPAGAARADQAMDMASALNTKLAYVITGAPDVDAMSRAGLYGLGLALKQRTAYEPTDPVGVDVETDDLSFYPLLYWPMVPSQPDLSPAAIDKLNAFMRNGGTILFDTRGGPLSGLGNAASPGEATLRRLLQKLDIPPLEPIPADHVLTKAFYLLQDFSGRWAGGTVWVEALPPPDPDLGPQPARGGDGVSPVIIGGNDWASAWATDATGRPLAAVVPGGERQREMAYRFGVNVVMYAMTGNYKTDQVHVPALLERLGQ